MNPASANDTLLILTAIFSACLLLFLQAGFALSEAGLSRAKNAANIMLRGFANIGIGGLLFWAAGFGLLFGSSNGIAGSSHFFLSPSGPGASREYALWLQQTMCAVTAGSIIFGATAERMRFGAALLLSAIMSLLIYPLAGHWIWGNLLVAGNASSSAWLTGRGFIDFAGSAAIHCTGGFAALAAAMAVGPRLGKFGKDGSARPIAGHNLTLASLGVMMVYFGWFGFTSTTALLTPGANAGRVAMNVLLAGFAGSAASLLVNWHRFGKPDVSMSLNGALGGLVAISASCAIVPPGFAVAIGAAAGALVVFSVLFLDEARVDDPVGAISIHGVCGAFGTVAVGAFHKAPLEQLVTQAMGVAAVFVWSFGFTFVLLKGCDLLGSVRASAEDEIAGLDLAEHGAQAYGDGLGVSTLDAPTTLRNRKSHTRPDPRLSPVT
jgi:ammonium transporter, Amt family